LATVVPLAAMPRPESGSGMSSLGVHAAVFARAVSVEEGLELCRAAANAGTRVLFATPHMHEPLDSFPWTLEREQRYEEAFAVMQPTAERMGLDLRRGREVYPTEALHGVLEGLRLDGTSAVLVEFPGSWLDVADAVGLTWAACEQIDAEGLVPVLAHPERCPAVAADPASVYGRNIGGTMAITGESCASSKSWIPAPAPHRTSRPRHCRDRQHRGSTARRNAATTRKE
jgi:hypothetical protein